MKSVMVLLALLTHITVAWADKTDATHSSGVSPFDDILVVAHQNSPIQSLSKQQVKVLFLGRIPALPATPILIDYPLSDPIREYFYEHATGKSLAYVVRSWARHAFSGRRFPPVIISSQQEVGKLLRTNPKTYIAYVERKNLKDDMKVLFTLTAH